MGTRLFIGNLSFEATSDAIAGLFGQAGRVAGVHLVTDPETGQRRGFGFVDMDSDQDAQRAVGMFNGQPFMDRPLRVNPAYPHQSTDEAPQRETSSGRRGSGREIHVVDGQVDQALKLLKRQLAKDGLFKEMKRRAFYEKPSARRKRKRQEARRKRLKALRSRGPERD